MSSIFEFTYIHFIYLYEYFYMLLKNYYLFFSIYNILTKNIFTLSEYNLVQFTNYFQKRMRILFLIDNLM